MLVYIYIYIPYMDPMGIITMLLVFRMGGGLATSNFCGGLAARTLPLRSDSLWPWPVETGVGW